MTFELPTQQKQAPATATSKRNTVLMLLHTPLVPSQVVANIPARLLNKLTKQPKQTLG